MIKIPVPPDKDNRDNVILAEICKRICILTSPDNECPPQGRGFSHYGFLTWRIIHELSAAGYRIVPQHNVGIPANDWKDHMESIHWWSILW